MASVWIKAFAKRWPRTTALGLGLVSAAVALVLCELGARRFYPLPESRDSFGCRQVRPELGGGFQANCSSRWLRQSGSSTAFDIQFSADAFGRRITPQRALAARRQLALFMGCSLTLGAGVEADQTLPFYFGELAKQYRVLNYGGQGFGPQQTLVRLETGLSTDELGPFEGEPLMIYTMIPAHVDRAEGSRQVLGTFGRYFPSYSLAPNGQLVFEGTFAAAHPLRTLLARLSTSSALLHRLPDPRDAGDVELTVRLVLEASRRFHERFRSDRFVVVAYPGDWRPGARLVDRLRSLGVTVLGSQDLFRPDESELRLLDGHPTAASYSRVAEWLFHELEQRALLDAQAEYQSTAKK